MSCCAAVIFLVLATVPFPALSFQLLPTWRLFSGCDLSRIFLFLPTLVFFIGTSGLPPLPTVTAVAECKCGLLVPTVVFAVLTNCWPVLPRPTFVLLQPILRLGIAAASHFPT